MSNFESDMEREKRINKHTPGSKWDESRIEQAYQLALLGFTEKQIADEMEINLQTLYYWKDNMEGFGKRLQEGKTVADAKVAGELYKNCFDRFIKYKTQHIDGGRMVEVERTVFIQGDKWAQARWLALRQKGLWSEVQKLELTQNNINITKIDLTGYTTEELKLLGKISTRQLAQNIELNDREN